MPFYSYLKPRDRDTPERKAWKKRTASRLVSLRAALKEHIYGKPEGGDAEALRNENQWLRIATWNIREFDTRKYGGRLRESLYYIAEILSHFDLIALQEVREDTRALETIIRLLGRHDWEYIATDVTEGRPGNRERMVFVYNNKKVRFTNIAGELTLPHKDRITSPFGSSLEDPSGLKLRLPPNAPLSFPETIKTRRSGGKVKLSENVVIDLPEGTGIVLPGGCRLLLSKGKEVTVTDEGVRIMPDGDANPVCDESDKLLFPDGIIRENALQFARTPFLVTFQAGWLKFILCTVHIYYGSGKEGMERRNREIRKLTEFLADRAKKENDTDADNFFFVLGDFNILGKDHATWESLHTNDFMVPAALREIPKGSNVKRDKAYDQIAFWKRKRRREGQQTAVDTGNAGIFDFFRYVFRYGDDDPEQEDERYYAAEVGKTRLSYSTWRTYQMSDHLPMWLEVRIDFGDDYLAAISD